jgi:hypothetical protein
MSFDLLKIARRRRGLVAPPPMDEQSADDEPHWRIE